MDKIIVSVKNWKKGIKSYGDKNVIHWRSSGALRFGLEDVVAPGVWIAAHIQGRTNVSSIKQIKFSGLVYDGDVLRMNEVQEWARKKRNYIFTRGDDEVCEMRGVKFDKYSEAPEIFAPEKVIHTYDTIVFSRNLKRFMASMGVKYTNGFPNMYAVALSASALLDFGKKKNFVGVHASQSFDVHEDFEEGPLSLLISKGRVKGSKEGGVHYFNKQWVQGGSVKATGRAGVVPLDSSKVVSPEFWRDLYIDVKHFLKRVV